MNSKELKEYIKNNMFNKNGQWKSTAHFKHIEEDLNRLQNTGETFSEKLYLFFNNKKTAKCLHCGNNTKFIKLSQGYRDYCSIKCSSNSKEKKDQIKKTVKEKYGVYYITQTESHKKAVKENYLNKLSDEEYNNKIIKKRINTVKEKYGVSNVSEVKEFTEKRIKTSIDKFGEDNYNNRIKAKETRTKNSYNNLNNRTDKLVTPLFKEYIDVTTIYKWKCNKCGEEFEDHLNDGHIPRCKICYPNMTGIQTSSYETEIDKWLNDIGIDEAILNDRTLIYPQELDIYIPSHNLAIEFNGLYWHSDKFKNKTYHLDKTVKCENNGIQLIHIFEDEWLNKQDIVKNIIKVKLGLVGNKIYGRKTVIKELSNKECKDFLNTSHVQGYISAKVNIGLYYEDELVSLLTFGKSRYNKKYDWEILRFVNKLNTSVIGGFSKLLKYFRCNYEGSIITYSDRRLFDGSIYENSGFTRLKPSTINYYYTEHHYRFNRQNFMKHKLKDKLEVFDPLLTEWQNMQMNGWDRIWDCGNHKFILK